MKGTAASLAALLVCDDQHVPFLCRRTVRDVLDGEGAAAAFQVAQDLQRWCEKQGAGPLSISTSAGDVDARVAELVGRAALAGPADWERAVALTAAMSATLSDLLTGGWRDKGPKPAPKRAAPATDPPSTP